MMEVTVGKKVENYKAKFRRTKVIKDNTKHGELTTVTIFPVGMVRVQSTLAEMLSPVIAKAAHAPAVKPKTKYRSPKSGKESS